MQCRFAVIDVAGALPSKKKKPPSHSRRWMRPAARTTILTVPAADIQILYRWKLKKASPTTGTEPAASELVEPAEVVEAEPEREVEVENTEAGGKEGQADAEKPEPKKKRRKRG